MKNVKRIFLGVAIAALIIIVVLISLRAYYVAVALLVGALAISYREIWSLVRWGKLPPFDERVRGNIGKSIRNGFIFYALATSFLMLKLSFTTVGITDAVRLLGILFVSGAGVYMLSYIFYDWVEPKLSGRGLKMMKRFMLVAGISLAIFVVSVFLHNAIYALFEVEEAVFFIIAVIVAPLGFAVGLIGSLVVFVKGLLS